MNLKIDISKLNASAYNPRKISDDAFARLKDSIVAHSEAVGARPGLRLVDPVIINKKNMRIVGGHQRISALAALGQDFVFAEDIRFVDVDDDKKEAALNIALNNPAAQGDFDFPKLKDVISEIDVGAFNIETFTAFSDTELRAMFDYLLEIKNPETKKVETCGSWVAGLACAWGFEAMCDKIACASTRAKPEEGLK